MSSRSLRSSKNLHHRITLYELAPTRSARCRWTLLEAGLKFESVGGTLKIIHSEALCAVHPLGKLPAIVIDGPPLYESAAISTAIADLVPDRKAWDLVESLARSVGELRLDRDGILVVEQRTQLK